MDTKTLAKLVKLLHKLIDTADEKQIVRIANGLVKLLSEKYFNEFQP